jgi:hypothetical protein
MQQRLAALLLLALAAFAAVPVALGAEVTRTAYREEVEPICQQNTLANEKILKGVRKEVKEGKLKLAGSKFSRAATALHKTLLQLKAVPQPSADEARLAKWLRYVATEAELFKTAAAKLSAGQEAAAQSVAVRLSHNATLANNTVLPFEFRYCRFEPSRFT